MDVKDKLVTAESLKYLNDTITANTVPKSGGYFRGTVGIDRKDGTASAQGTSAIWLGNSTPVGTAENSKGQVVMYGNSNKFGVLQATNVTDNRTLEFPDANGTITLNNCKYLTSGTDLNDLKNDGDTGWYGFPTGILNCPTTWGSLLIMAGGQGVTQIIFKANYIYTRMYTGSPLAWTTWFTYRSDGQRLWTQATLSNASMTNCTGAISGWPAIWQNDAHDEFLVTGRFTVNNFVRTGNAPTFSANTNFRPAYNVVGQSAIKFENGVAKPELVTLRINTTGVFSIELSSETYAYTASGTLVILCPIMHMVRI